MNTIELLKLFCGNDNNSQPTCPPHPFLTGDGYTCATDGRVCVRWHGEVAGVAPFGDKPHPLLELDWDRTHYAAETTPIPDFDETAVVCSKCAGTGILPERLCGACSGMGKRECDMSFTHDCHKCGGVGAFPPAPCGRCQNGKLPDKRRIELTPGYGYQARYLAKLRRIGASCYLPKNNAAAMRFVFDGGDGLLMPLTRSENYQKQTEALTQ